MAKAIDLGKQPGELPPVISINDIPHRIHYPDLYISDVDDPRLLDMPDKGSCTIKYRIVGRNHSEDQRNGKKERRCSIRMEIISIEPPEPKKKNNGYGDDARKSFSDYFNGK